MKAQIMADLDLQECKIGGGVGGGGDFSWLCGSRNKVGSRFLCLSGHEVEKS